MRRLALALVLVLLGGVPAMADFTFGFTWGDIPLCTTGHPGIVPSPRFVLSGVPEGTDIITFRLRDLDAPGFNHGGGSVAVSGGGDGVIPEGAFTYKSPCPPGVVHTYEWEAIARHGDTPLAEATVRRDYPE